MPRAAVAAAATWHNTSTRDSNMGHTVWPLYLYT